MDHASTLAHHREVVAKEQTGCSRRKKFAELRIFLVRRQKRLVVPELGALSGKRVAQAGGLP
jgi:hypothetical protein